MTAAREKALLLAKRARHYLANSRKLIREEPKSADKAGEILWGAVVLAVKAVAAARGKKVSKYQQIRAFLVGIVGERSEAMRDFKSFKSFHGAFYEGETATNDVRISLDDAEVWIDALLAEDNL